MRAAFFFFLSFKNGAYMLDFSLLADFAEQFEFAQGARSFAFVSDSGQNRKKKNKKKKQTALYDDLPF